MRYWTTCLLLLSFFITAQLLCAKSLTLAIHGSPDEGFDPLLGWGRYGSPLFQSTLIKRNTKLEFVSDLATKWSLSKDRLKWTITLRKDVLFSDGTPLTAQDVAYTYNMARNSQGKVDATILKEAKATSDFSVELILKSPQITFVDTMATLGIVPQKIHQAKGKLYGRAPVGSGPYMFVSWQEGQHLKVKKNPRYYGTKPQFDELTFLFTDEESSFAMAQSGQLHIVSVPPILAKTTLPKMKLYAIDSVDNRGLSLPVIAEYTDEKGLIHGNNVTADLAMRQAINYAINRQEIVKGVLDGFGSVAYNSVTGLPWENKETHFQDNNVVLAEKILKEAHWLKGKDGILQKGNITAKLTILYTSDDKTRQYMALALKQQLAKIGISVDIQGMSWEVIEKHYHHHPVLFGWGGHNPLELYDLHHSKMIGQPFFNVGHYKNKNVDNYLDLAQKAPSFEASLPLWKKAQWDGKQGFAAQGDAPWAWIVNIKHTYLVDRCLDLGTPQVEPHDHGWPLTANIDEWKWTCP